jgi:hypothetical protein
MRTATLARCNRPLRWDLSIVLAMVRWAYAERARLRAERRHRARATQPAHPT